MMTQDDVDAYNNFKTKNTKGKTPERNSKKGGELLSAN